MADQDLPVEQPAQPDLWDTVYAYYDAARLDRMRLAIEAILSRIKVEEWDNPGFADEEIQRAQHWEMLLNNTLRTFLNPDRVGGFLEVHAGSEGRPPIVTLSFVFLRLSREKFLLFTRIDMPSPMTNPGKFADEFIDAIAAFIKLKQNLRNVENTNPPEVGPGKGPAIPPA